MTTATAIPTTCRFSAGPSTKPINQRFRDSVRDYGTGVKNRLFRAKTAVTSTQWYATFKEMFLWFSAFMAAYICVVFIICVILALLGL